MDVKDDETGCGGGDVMKSYDVVIQHHRQTVDIGDMGHGKTQGFFTGNWLTMPARTIRDGAGYSKLSVADLDFFSDCSRFVGYYTWQYADSSMSCSGNTKVWGKRLDGKGCPAVAQKSAEQQRQELADIRANPDIASKERRYKEILEKDPKNFWANWDMAELRKKQGNYNEYFSYFNKAASNENIFADTREKLKKEEARRLRLSEFPTAGKSPILRIEQGELDNWWRTPIYNVNVPKEVTAGKGWGITIWRLLVPEDKANNMVNKAIYE
ncbi:MAG: hypothetical protein HY555_03385 [Euryarchaeota archaeon]|nr:hypothetical protein [Euryarchaeota archaeon]